MERSLQFQSNSDQSLAGPGEGKIRSRQNALKHGLTATTLIDKLIGGEVLDLHRRRLYEEWHPATPTEEILVADMARHAAALALAERAEAAVLRLGASTLQSLAVTDALVGDAETSLAGAITTDGIERVTRYRRAHEKAFHQALLRLRECKDRDNKPHVSVLAEGMFTNEADCKAYLFSWFQGRGGRCPVCGGVGGCWVARGNQWECGTCHRQFGLRHGTVMAHSRVPLTAWFAVIRTVVNDKQITTDELVTLTGIRRLKTVRNMLHRVCAAARDQNVNELLAGLDRIFATHTP